MGGDIFSGTILNKAQADGPQIVSLGPDDRFREHQVQIEVSAQPAAGTLAIAIKSPGASAFSIVETVDMTDITPANAKVVQFKGYASQIRFTPADLDAGKTYSVFVVSGAGV